MSELIYSTIVMQKQHVTHDVVRLTCIKPPSFEFTEGQAVEVAIIKKGWDQKTRPFTMTSLSNDNVLEFIIKIYYEHEGVTEQINRLEVGSELALSKPFGAIKYQGQGVFIAGGAGVTPFISILRSQKNKSQDNTVIFANKTPRDVILEKELGVLTNNNLINVFSDKAPAGESCKRITQSYLSETISDFSQAFYICGPPEFTKDIKEHLSMLGAEPSAITLEE